MYAREAVVRYSCLVNTLRPELNGWHFADIIFKRIFLNKNDVILIIISINYD